MGIVIGIVAGVFGFFCCYCLVGGLYTINQNERAILTNFGRAERLTVAGHPVGRLVRTQVGPVSLGSLRPGTSRRLSATEVGNLYAAVRM